MLDKIDLTLLEALQADASLSHASLGKRSGLSPAGVHKRLARLKKEGVIRQTTALLDRSKLGLDLLCFLKVTFRDNMRTENLAEFTSAVRSLPEVLEAYSITGATDALLKVLVRDQGALREFLRRLSEFQNLIERVETCLVLEEFKDSHILPLNRP